MHRAHLHTMLLALALAAGCRPTGKDQKADKADAKKSEETHSFDAKAVETFGQSIEITNKSGSSSILTQVDTTEKDEDLKSVLDQCGIDDLSDPDRETFKTVMTYDYVRTINAGFAKAIVPLKSILDLSGTLSETTLNVGVEVGNVAGEDHGEALKDVSAIDQRAEQLAATFRGPATAFSIPQNSNFVKAWKGILCTITGADRLLNKRSGYTTETSFNPPFAPNISPIAERGRYEKEIGDYRYFHNIEAKVTSTDHPLLKGGQIFIGNILVEKIPSRKETPHGIVEGDLAYRISNRFGSEEETLALGFHIWTEYYIDLAKHTFSAVIANVGDEETMHFIGSYSQGGQP